MTAVEWKRAPMGRLAIVAALLVVPLVAVAQPAKKAPRVGVAVAGALECKPDARTESFYRGFRELGYVIGTSIHIDRRCYRNADEMRKVLSVFVAAKVDAVAVGTPAGAIAARELTRDIPIVCSSCGDPLDNGLVTSLSRPGGNVTGFASLSAELIGKRLGLLKETIPGIARVVAVINPDNPGTRPTLKALDEAGRALGLEIPLVEFRTADDLDRALKEAATKGAGAIMIQDDPFAYAGRKLAVALALKLRLPASAGLNEYADEGLLMSYGPNRDDMVFRAAGYIHRILKGAKPGDLPFDQPSQFDLVINLRTAKALGITIPHSVMVQATRVIR